MELAIVTFTHNTFGGRGHLLDRCIKSLGNLKKYQIIKTLPSYDFAKERIDSLKLAEYVCFVDDDDEICNNSVERCYDAITKYKTGIVFTDELLVDQSGNEINLRSGPRYYNEICSRPHRIHHLSMICTKYLNDVNLDHLLGHIRGVDWYIRSKAISIAGAMHLPITGYKWYQYKDSLNNISPVNQIPLKMDIKFKGQIPQITHYSDVY